MVVLLRTCPRPSQVGHISVVSRVTLSRTRLRVISTRPMSLILRTLVLARSAPRAPWALLVEVDAARAAAVAQPQRVDDLLRRLAVDLGDGVLEGGAGALLSDV